MKNILLASLIGLVITIGSGFIPNWSISQDPRSDYDNCSDGCPIAGAGYPLAYVIDKRYISPVGSADIIGGIINDDKVLWGKFIFSFLFWAWVILITKVSFRKNTKE